MLLRSVACLLHMFACCCVVLHAFASCYNSLFACVCVVPVLHDVARFCMYVHDVVACCCMCLNAVASFSYMYMLLLHGAACVCMNLHVFA